MLLRHEGFRKLCEARDLLRDVSQTAMTIDGIARTIGISRAHFIRQFEALFGVTPHQYRIDARLDLACDLLARGDRSVTDVCLDVGFSSLGSFSSLFARRIGEAPSVYRRRRRRFVVAGQLAPAATTQPGCLTLLAHLPSDQTFREAPTPSR
jgi:AraC-like DNA-binding protein